MRTVECNEHRWGVRWRGMSILVALLTLLAACTAPAMHGPAFQSRSATPGHAGFEPPTSSTPVPLTPLVLAVPVPPQAVAASHRRTHLTYEVLVTNITRQALRVRSLAVHAAGDARVLLRYEGAAVAARMSLLADATVPDGIRRRCSPSPRCLRATVGLIPRTSGRGRHSRRWSAAARQWWPDRDPNRSSTSVIRVTSASASASGRVRLAKISIGVRAAPAKCSMWPSATATTKW